MLRKLLTANAEKLTSCKIPHIFIGEAINFIVKQQHLTLSIFLTKSSKPIPLFPWEIHVFMMYILSSVRVSLVLSPHPCRFVLISKLFFHFRYVFTVINIHPFLYSLVLCFLSYKVDLLIHPF